MKFLPVAVFLLLASVWAPAEAYTPISVQAGGGWSGARGDSSEYVHNGIVGAVGLELEVGLNLGLVLDAMWHRFDANAGKLRTSLGLPDDDPIDARTTVYELNFAPKLYLLKQDISAYLMAGGGPRWAHRENTTGPSPGVTRSRTEQGWGTVAGFGVEALFADGFRLGFSPAYRVVYADRGNIETVTYVFYIKI